MGDLIATYLSITWAIGLVAGFLFCVSHLDKDEHNNQIAAVAVLLFVFGPLVTPVAAIGYGGYGVYWLGGGFKGLWRSVFPKPVELPKARIHVDTK